MLRKINLMKVTAAALFLGVLLVVPGVVNAYRGDPSIKGPNCTEERSQEMEQAFEENDYNAWKNLMQGKGKVTQIVNEGNFTQFAEAHRLAGEGRIDEANQIRTELGLGLGNGSGNGQGNGSGQGYMGGR